MKQCFADNGANSTDIPCDPDAEVSACCGSGSVCVQNFYCRDTYGDSVPGSCTDQQWGIALVPNPSCPCRPYFRENSIIPNYLDSATMCPDGTVCCGIANVDCCNAGKGNPIIEFHNTATVPTGTTSIATYYTGLTVTTRPVTRMSGTTSATSTTSPSTGATSGLSSGARIGIGVGVGLTGALLIIAIIFLFVFRRRYLRLKDKSPSGSMQEHLEPARNSEPYEKPDMSASVTDHSQSMSKLGDHNNLPPQELPAENHLDDVATSSRRTEQVIPRRPVGANVQ